MLLNVCYYRWDLDADVCPCDVHFDEWVGEQGVTDSVIYHFGTGMHHTVGVEQTTNGSGNVVLAITASVEELQAYTDLVSQHAEVAKRYHVYFGDIYLTEARLLPALDVVTMFHLCEFSDWNTTTEEYGGLTDRQVLEAFTSKVRPGGHLLFYPGSHGWDETEKIIKRWEREQPVDRVGQFKGLLVYRKSADVERRPAFFVPEQLVSPESPAPPPAPRSRRVSSPASPA